MQNLSSIYTESMGNFYSPMGSPNSSVQRFEVNQCVCPFEPVSLTQAEVNFLNYTVLFFKLYFYIHCVLIC